MRTAQMFLWLEPDDCIPPHGLDMKSSRDINKVEHLRQAFVQYGFALNQPALVGYPLDGKIQLLSGTHRHLAASWAGKKLPVTVWLRSDIQRMWGTDLWDVVMEDIPVSQLMNAQVEDVFHTPPYEPVTEIVYDAEDINDL